MQGPTYGLSQQAAEAGGSLTPETRGRAGAASTTPGRVGTARRPGSGKRDGEVYECRNQWWNPLKTCGPARTWWMWAGMAARRASLQPGGALRCGGIGGHGEELRRSRGQACRGKAGHLSRQPVCGERGNRRRVAYPSASRVDGGKARRLLMARRRGGGSVVVRGRESRSHGEGTQRVRDAGTGMPGGRR